MAHFSVTDSDPLSEWELPDETCCTNPSLVCPKCALKILNSRKQRQTYLLANEEQEEEDDDFLPLPEPVVANADSDAGYDPDAPLVPPSLTAMLANERKANAGHEAAVDEDDILPLPRLF